MDLWYIGCSEGEGLWAPKLRPIRNSNQQLALSTTQKATVLCDGGKECILSEISSDTKRLLQQEYIIYY